MELSSEIPTKQTLKLRAVGVLGSEKAATAWFKTKALGLDGLRPEELLRTREGRDKLHVFLTRLDHNVYT